mgnify:CR=1 FL=1
MLWKIPGWTEKFIAVTAERKFREYIQTFVKERNLTPSTLGYLAKTDTPLSEILSRSEIEVTPMPGAWNNPWGAHLLGLSDEAILKLLRQAIPTHLEAVDPFPGYALKIAREIKDLVYGKP